MMTTDQRAELDAVMARATIARDDCQYYSMSQPFERTREAENMLNLAMRMTPLLTAHIDAQAATIAGLRQALLVARGQFAYYAIQHRNKTPVTADTLHKAEVNDSHVERIDAALTGAA